jgi:ABC-type microcin C transport system duplicated ATPase subunit YejF
LPWVEKHVGLALAESQVAAVRLALMSKVTVMTGGPGVGKTTIVKAILRILAAKGTETGRAAKRLTEARQGVVPLRKALPDILSSNTNILSPRMVSLIADLMQDWHRLDERIDIPTR